MNITRPSKFLSFMFVCPWKGVVVDGIERRWNVMDESCLESRVECSLNLVV